MLCSWIGELYFVYMSSASRLAISLSGNRFLLVGYQMGLLEVTRYSVFSAAGHGSKYVL